MPRDHGAGALNSDHFYAQGKRGWAKRPKAPGAQRDRNEARPAPRGRAACTEESVALPAFLPGSACWDQRGVLRSFSWDSGPFLRDQLLAPRDQALVPRDQALFPALGSAPVLPPPPSPLGLLSPGTVFLAAGFYAGPPAEAFCPRGHQKLKDRRCTARLCRPPAPAEHIVLRAKLDASPSLAAKQASSRRADPCLSTR